MKTDTQPASTSPVDAASARPISDRWTFKPIALLLLLAVLIASSALLAVLISPPFLAAGVGVKELQSRLDAAGAEFTKIPHLPQRSTIYAADGKTVLAHIYLDNREVVPLDKISPWAKKAVLATEDSGFYHHGAIDVLSLVRAAVANIRAGSIVQGGSTITQQLVKNTLEDDPNDQTISRKFKELALAERVEQHYTKDQIFELYLNEVFLSNNVYGIGTAARFYFHKSAEHLNLQESALLAGIIRAPGKYDPIAHRHAAYLRRNDVLNRMISLGPKNGGVSAKRGQAAKDSFLGLNVGGDYLPTPPFLVDYMRDQLINDPNGWYGVLGDTPQAREQALKEGGLKIITTLQPSWQKDAQKAANAPWAATPSNPGYKPEPDVGLVSLETRTGAIRTMLSGRDYQKDQINTVTTQHQPGSSFKPYVLAAAFEQGILPSATYSGAQGPVAGCYNGDGTIWNVTNAEGTSLGSLDLYHATAESVNAVFARLTEDVGPANVVDMAHRTGITTYLPAVCALGTGSVGITPLDQASGYQTFANSGMHCKPYAVSQIIRGDRMIYDQVPDCERVVSAPIANLVNDLLKGPVTYGTASSVFSSGWGKWPIRGKTGTADSNNELWFAGYTRQITTAVWVGSPHIPYSMTNYWGYSVFGGSIAAPIWKAFMLDVLAGKPARRFPPAKLDKVPKLIGLQKREAIKLLKKAKYDYTIKIVDSYLPKGEVIEQTPAPGTQTIPGVTKVKLQVSNGKAPHHTMPSVKGLSLTQASALLDAINVFPTVAEKETNDPKLNGIVYGVNPDAGSDVLEGSSATLFVWIYPTPTQSPSPGGGGNGGGGGGNGGGGGGGGGNGGGGGGGNGNGNPNHTRIVLARR
jgi:membrane peptidoglycan carboxypeptidase